MGCGFRTALFDHFLPRRQDHGRVDTGMERGGEGEQVRRPGGRERPQPVGVQTAVGSEAGVDAQDGVTGSRVKRGA